MAFDAPFLVIGHRGAAGLAPENTLASFARAVALGVHAVELDVHVCEGQLCVIHDDTLDRTTNGRGKVADVTLEELRALDAGDGNHVPLLEEVLDALPAEVGVNVELKGAGTGVVLAEMLDAGRPLLVSSFDHGELEQFHERRAEVCVAPLFGRWRDDALRVAGSFQSRFLNLSRRAATAAHVGAARAAGLEVLVYTVNDAAEAERFASLGVKGVFTDYPDRIRPSAPADQSPA